MQHERRSAVTRVDGWRSVRVAAAAVGLCLTVVSTSLALTTAPASAGDGTAASPVLDIAPASAAPAAAPPAGTTAGSASGPSVDYPVPATCPWGSIDNDCQKVSPYLDVTLSADEVESGGDLVMTVSPAGEACNNTTGPYRDCYVKELLYMGAGYSFLPRFGPAASVNLEYGTDGTICYQYVPVCQFRTTYLGEFPSRWVAVTGVSYRRTVDPPPDGYAWATVSTPGGYAYQWYSGEQALYRVTGTNATPTADFTVTPVDGQPGAFDYASTSKDPAGGPLTHTWTFADGSTSAATSVRKTYAKPGTFPVRLDVVTGQGLSASKTRNTIVEAPTLDLTVKVTGEPTSLDLDEEVEVQVVAKALDDGVGSLTGLKLAGDGLASSDGETLEITTPLTPAPGTAFTLAPGTSKTFKARVTARQAGTADLTASVTGKDAIGRPVSDDATLEVRIRSAALALTLSLDREELTLAEDDDGPKATTVELTVTGTNKTEGDLTDISLLSILPSWQPDLPFTASFPSSILVPVDGPGPDGLAIDDLGPGESFEKTFAVKVLDDGHLRLSMDATYASVDGGTDLATADIDLLSKPARMLSFEAEADASVDDSAVDPWNPPDAVEAGRSFLVVGRLKNLTTDQRIIATVPASERNQVSSVNLGKLEEEWDNPAMPFRADIDPGSSQAVHAKPVAVPLPAKDGALTFAEYRYDPAGKALLREEDEVVDVAPEAIAAPLEKRTFRVPIVWAPPRPAPSAIELYGLFSVAFIESTAAWWSDAAATAGDVLTALAEVQAGGWAVITDPVAREQFRQRVTGAWASFVHNIDLMRETIATLSPEERLRLIQEISNPFLLYLKAGRAIVTSEQAQAAARAIGTAIDRTWTRITTLGGEDPRELARILGSGSGTVFNEVTVGMVTDAAIAKLFTKIRYGSNLAKAQEFVDEAAAAKAAEGLRIDKGLKGIPAGAVLTDEVLTIGLGVTRAEKNQLLAVAKRFNLNIMARSRGAGAAELIAKGRARLKPFGIDAKNVSDLDVLLGFPASMKDTVAIRKPNAWADILGSSEYRALDAEQRAQVASRWQTRSKEWNGGGKLKETAPGEWKVAEPPPDAVGAERAKFLKAAEDKGFDLQYPTAGNWEEVAVDGKALGTARADFGLKTTTDAQGFEVLQPYMSDGKGKGLLPITGDVDLVALLNPDGTYPSVEKIIAAYAELAKPPLGMQHPATWSFNIQGKSMDLLSDHVLGGATAEPLAAFGPTGKITAVLFDPKMSLVPSDRRANPALLLKVAGGIKLPSHAYGLGAALPIFLENGSKKTTPYYVPESWQAAQDHVPAQKALRALPPSQAGVRFVRGAPPVEEQADRTLARYGSGWTTWDPLPAGQLPIAPQTCVAAGLAEGQRTIAVYRLSQLFEQTGSGGQAWFRAGDTVTVDLGGDHPWTTTLTKVTAGSVTFASPAPRAYLPGTPMHLRAAPSDTDDDPDGDGGSDGGGSGSGGGEGTAAGPGELARTGSATGALAMLGALLVVLGAAILALRRRPTPSNFVSALDRTGGP